MTVVLVCGGRTFAVEGADRDKYIKEHSYFLGVMEQLWEKRKPDMLIHGNANGPDKLAGQFALEQECNVMAIPAKWKTLDKKAGMLRNAEMLILANVDLVVAFPGGIGTAGMMKLAREKEIPIVDLTDDWKSKNEIPNK